MTQLYKVYTSEYVSATFSLYPVFLYSLWTNCMEWFCASFLSVDHVHFKAWLTELVQLHGHCATEEFRAEGSDFIS